VDSEMVEESPLPPAQASWVRAGSVRG